MKKTIRSIAALAIALILIVGSAPSVKAASFNPRYSAPSYSNDYYYSSMNLFYASGYGMPNCTAYAYGRAYEILGYAPNLCPYNAGEWYDYNKRYGFYGYGSTPRVGAIAVWDDWNGDDGHVAVVEEVHSDGTVLVSESTWGGVTFRLRNMNADSSDGYMYYYRFLGYIYITGGSGNSSSSSGTPSGSTGRPTVQFGSTGSAVTALQQYLYDLGYLNLAPDGYFGSMTDSAVRVYQQMNGLAIDGVVGSQTWRVLDSGASIKASSSGVGSGNGLAAQGGTSSATPSTGNSSSSSDSGDMTLNPDTLPNISRGSSNTQAVMVLQQALTGLGYNVGGVDGIFGGMTEAAVIQFQSNNGLIVDGMVGNQTWTALKAGKTNFSEESKVPVNTPESTTAKPSGTSTVLVAANMKTLELGSENDHVRILQELLVALGYNAGPADGILGSQTYYAVLSYQVDHDLASDGVVGKQTWTSLLGQ